MISLINSALGATINTNLPGPYSVATGGPVAIVANAYYLALALGGLLAFGSIVYAGIKWTASRGNASVISDAQDQITQAVIGLLILLGTYIILNTINPTLTLLNIPQLSEIKSEVVAPPPSGGNPNDGYCTKEHSGACSLISQSCEKQDDGTFSCVVRNEAMWACYNGNSMLKACYPVGSSDIGNNLPKKSQCDTYCQENFKLDCVASIKPKSGCRIQ